MTESQGVDATRESAAAYDVHDLACDVLDGLTRPFKELSSRFLYDERGAELFELILDLPEYYQGRTETALLEEHACAIVQAVTPTELVDVGAGSGEKTRVLLNAAAQASGFTYIPVDMSPDMLETCANEAQSSFGELVVRPVQADFTDLIGAVSLPEAGARRLVVMLGGTIGNLLPGTRRRFWQDLRAIAGVDGALLVGIDLLKDPTVIEAAYDDAAGITAAFNKNLLQTLNDRLDADFDLDAFDHVVIFDDANSWIEMRLRARRRCRIRIEFLAWDLELSPGEEIRTEISAKYSRSSFEREVGWAGLCVTEWLVDTSERFALPLLTVNSHCS